LYSIILYRDPVRLRLSQGASLKPHELRGVRAAPLSPELRDKQALLDIIDGPGQDDQEMMEEAMLETFFECGRKSSANVHPDSRAGLLPAR
jgi:hypothetical protein